MHAFLKPSKHCCARLVSKNWELFTVTSWQTWTYWSLVSEQTKSYLIISRGNLLNLIFFAKVMQSLTLSISPNNNFTKSTTSAFLMSEETQHSPSSPSVDHYSTMSWIVSHAPVRPLRSSSRNVVLPSLQHKVRRLKTCSDRCVLVGCSWLMTTVKNSQVLFASMLCDLNSCMRLMRWEGGHTFFQRIQWYTSCPSVRMASTSLLRTQLTMSPMRSGS